MYEVDYNNRTSDASNYLYCHIIVFDQKDYKMITVIVIVIIIIIIIIIIFRNG